MSVAEIINLMLNFGMFIGLMVTIVIAITKDNKKQSRLKLLLAEVNEIIF